MALFGPSAGARREPRSLVEFRAGKMTLKNRTVTPDKRKGLVFMKMDDGQLLHFCWKDRTSGLVEDVRVWAHVAACASNRHTWHILLSQRPATSRT